MSKPVVVSISHRLGRDEATRRIKDGLGSARGKFASVLTIQEENWVGNLLTFRASALGQTASGTIEVREDDVRLEVTLPWLLAKMAEKISPAIQKEGQLLLDKK